MAPGNQLLSITSEAYANSEANFEFSCSSYLHHQSSTGSGSSDPCSLNSTLTANEGSTIEEDAASVERCLSSPMPPLQCLHCERISSECICLDSDEEEALGGEVKVQNLPSSEWMFQQHTGEDVAINHGKHPSVCCSSFYERQMFEHQQHLQQPATEVQRPLPSFEQLLASLGLNAGFVIYRNRHQ